MVYELQSSEFRKHLREVLDRVDRGALAVVTRRGSAERHAVLPLEEVAPQFEQYEFHPEVITDQPDGSVVVWIEELGIYGSGAALSEALDDLVGEALRYLEEWERGLSTAPNQAERRGWVRRLQLHADDHAALQAILSGPTPV